MCFLRRALRLRNPHVRDLHLDNDALLQRLGVPSLHTLLLQRGCRWPGHVAPVSPHPIPHAVLFGTIPRRSFLKATELGAVSHRYILVVLACGCKASLVLKQLFGRAITVLSAENRAPAQFWGVAERSGELKPWFLQWPCISSLQQTMKAISEGG